MNQYNMCVPAVWASFMCVLSSPCRLGKACCEACPSRLVASGGGLPGGCKAGLTLKQ